LARLAAEGTVTSVYQARPADGDPSLPPRYALKLLRREWEGSPQAVASIRREAAAGRAVSSRHVVSLLASHTGRAPYFLVFPWLAGETLTARLLRLGPLNVNAALWIARQIAQGLVPLFQAGWRHGDIKPENVLISGAGHVTLLDLGSARRHDEQESIVEPTMGTVHYLAPEAITSRYRGDIRSDLYSLGVMLYQMLSGRLPFEGAQVGEIIRQHRQQEAPPLRQSSPLIPREVAGFVHSLLAKQPLRRPQTPQEAVERLVKLEIEALWTG
jgi:serine/threonine-protein kinase